MNPKVFAFCNQKGGVGKTTSVVNIAACLASEGYNVLVVDMDSQGNATSGLGQEKPADHESTTYQLIVENSELGTLVRQTQYQNLWLIPANMDLSGVELELISKDFLDTPIPRDIFVFSITIAPSVFKRAFQQGKHEHRERKMKKIHH